MTSFHEQLETSLPDLWRYAFSLTRDRTAADDLMQDCAERAMRKRFLWIPSRPLKPWLMKILLNTYRNQYRRAATMRLTNADENQVEMSISPNHDLRLELAETARGISQLPAEQREALLIVVVGGLGYNDAANALGIAQGTLMSRISRARAKLRQHRHDGTNTSIRRVK